MSDRLANERRETDQLEREALRLGIEIPRNPSWWWEDVDNFGGSLEQWEYERHDSRILQRLASPVPEN